MTSRRQRECCGRVGLGFVWSPRQTTSPVRPHMAVCMHACAGGNQGGALASADPRDARQHRPGRLQHLQALQCALRLCVQRHSSCLFCGITTGRWGMHVACVAVLGGRLCSDRIRLEQMADRSHLETVNNCMYRHTMASRPHCHVRYNVQHAWLGACTSCNRPRLLNGSVGVLHGVAGAAAAAPQECLQRHRIVRVADCPPALQRSRTCTRSGAPTDCLTQASGLAWPRVVCVLSQLQCACRHGMCARIVHRSAATALDQRIMDQQVNTNSWHGAAAAAHPTAWQAPPASR